MMTWSTVFRGTPWLLLLIALRAPAGEGPQFRLHRVGQFRSEACGVGDFTADGRLDIVAGPYVYVAPDWKPWKIRELKGEVDEQGMGYYWDFANLPLDVDRDGLLDVVSVDWFQKCIDWYRNVGPEGGPWPRKLIEENGNYECADLVDIDGDGEENEVLAHVQQTVWYERAGAATDSPGMVRHIVSPKLLDFGGGVGDVNGDGRPDILRTGAWYEAPADPRQGDWTEHPLAVGGKQPNTVGHTPQIVLFDVNADGLNDIITSAAHDYGIFWYQQVREGNSVTWKQHLIDDTWSQAHSLTLADIDGDGTPELFTGKRFLAHNGGDPGARAPGRVLVCTPARPPAQMDQARVVLQSGHRRGTEHPRRGPGRRRRLGRRGHGQVGWAGLVREHEPVVGRPSRNGRATHRRVDLTVSMPTIAGLDWNRKRQRVAAVQETRFGVRWPGTAFFFWVA